MLVLRCIDCVMLVYRRDTDSDPVINSLNFTYSKIPWVQCGDQDESDHLMLLVWHRRTSAVRFHLILVRHRSFQWLHFEQACLKQGFQNC